MKLQPEVKQKLKVQPKLSQHQRYALAVLAMNDTAFMAEAQRMVETNPLLEWAGGFSWDESGEGYDAALNTIAATETLQDVLLAQVYWSDFAYSYELAEFLIAALDDDGYLRMDDEEIAALCHSDPIAVSETIGALQQLEPAGVFARNVQECILIQLRNHNEPIAAIGERIVRDHIEKLAAHHYETIARALGVKLDEVQEAVALITSLNPRPGAQYAKAAVEVRPDASIYVEEGIVHIELTQRPDRFTITDHYHDVKEAETLAYIKKMTREAKLFIDSFHKRCSTLLAILTFMCEHQHDYFVHHSFLKPLTMRQCAEAIGFHESTVSRAVAKKTIMFENRVLPLRSFFPLTVNGNSRVHVIAALKELIQSENKHRPYSDAQLVALLEAQGISVSRRTIAKYRNQYRIGNALQRRK